MAARLADAHDEVSFVGTPDGLEARLVPEAGVSFRGLHARGFDRAKPWTLVTATARIAASAITAWRWMGTERPDVVMGFGGYVSIPVGLAAVVRGIPLVLHEQNSIPGLANRVLSRWARSVGVTYAESIEHLARPTRAIVTGNPVREAILAADGAAGRASLGVPADAVLLLAFGGSRGARHLNSALVGLRDELLAVDGLHIVHVAGPLEADTVKAALDVAGGDGGGRWQVLEYIADMGSVMAAADLVLARAGATSIAEITVLGKPAVLVPYPYATDDHQTRNAATMVAHGAAVLVSDGELDCERFGLELIGLLGDAERRASMAAASAELGRPDAAERVAAMAADTGHSTNTYAEDARA